MTGFGWLAERILSLRLPHAIGRLGALCTLCLALPALAQPVTPVGEGSLAAERLSPDLYPRDPVVVASESLREPYDPFFDIDWSLALRGSYIKGTSGERYDIRTIPSVTLEHAGTRSSIKGTGSAEILRSSDGRIDVTGLRLSGMLDYALDRDTTVTAAGRFIMSRDEAGTPGVASDIAIAPLTISGGGELGITRQFGRFNVGLGGAATRTVYGETTRADGRVVDNSDQNAWLLNSNLRVGYQLTPILEVFGKAGLGRDLLDQPSPSLGVRTDATTATLEGGVTGRWSEMLEATASTGLALRRFDAAGLGEVTAQTYNAELIFRPDPTLQLKAGLSTSVTPSGPDGSGSTRIGYTANGEIAYTVNSWLALRALARWNKASYSGSTDTENGYGAEAGAAYLLNAHTALSADYGYAQSESTTSGLQEAHKVTLGVTLAR